MASTSAAYQVRLDPDAARQAVEQGGTLLVLGVPPGTYMGVDHQGFTVGPKFKGVKMLPPGAHFLSYHAASKQGDFAPLTGFFFHVSPGAVLVRRWDPDNELLQHIADADEEERLVAGVKSFSFDDCLAAYNPQQAAAWHSLSCYITPQLIGKLSPVGDNISIMSEAEHHSTYAEPETAAERALNQQLQAAGQQGKCHSQDSSAQEAEGRGRAGRQAAPAAAAADTAADAMDVDQGGEHSAAAAAAGAAAGAVAAAAAGAGAGAGAGAAVGAASEVAMSEAATTEAAAQASTSGREQQEGRQSSGRCFYTHLPRLVKKAGASAAELTLLNLDKTPLLVQLVGEAYGGSGRLLLGELQFAFVAFMYGQSLAGLLQWKALLQLLLGCEAGPLHSHQQLFVLLLQLLTHQLQVTLAPQQGGLDMGMQAGAAPLLDELLRNSFLWQLLSSFFQLLDETSDTPAPLAQEAEKLKALLKSALDWNFGMQVLGDEDDEYAPVIVET